MHLVANDSRFDTHGTLAKSMITLEVYEIDMS